MEIIDKVWICDLVKNQTWQAHTTTVVNILSFLPPVKINLTTLLNIFAQGVASNQVNFLIFLEWKHVQKRVTLIKQNIALRKFQNMIFCYFQENRSPSNDFYNCIQTSALKVKFMSTTTDVKIKNLISSLVCVLYRIEKRSVRTFDKYIFDIILSHSNVCPTAWHFFSTTSTNKMEKIQEGPFVFFNLMIKTAHMEEYYRKPTYHLLKFVD